MRKRIAGAILNIYLVKESLIPYAKHRVNGEMANPMNVFRFHVFYMTLGTLHLKINLQNDYIFEFILPKTPNFSG